jgi:hypothetical protein
MSKPKRRSARPLRAGVGERHSPLDIYWSMWASLSPGERLRRSWRLRSRIRNLEAVHDEKSLPKL